MSIDRLRVKGAIVAAVLLAMALPAYSGEIETKARAVAEKYEKAVVTIQVVVKMKFSAPGMGSQENESRSEVAGVVVDPAGLTVTSLSSMDPQSVMEGMMQGGDEQFKSETSINDVKLLLDDSTEIAAQIVLRDKDLDLVFIRPTDKPAQPLTAIDLAQAGDAQVLDEVVALGRLGKVGNRAATVGLERIQAVVKRPRKFYVPGREPTQTSLGSPAFDLDGKVIGVFTLRMIKGESTSGFGSMFGGSDTMLPTIVAAADVLEVAKQAATAKPEEPKPAEAKPAEAPAAPAAPGAAPGAAVPVPAPAPAPAVVIPAK